MQKSAKLIIQWSDSADCKLDGGWGDVEIIIFTGKANYNDQCNANVLQLVLFPACVQNAADFKWM